MLAIANRKHILDMKNLRTCLCVLPIFWAQGALAQDYNRTLKEYIYINSNAHSIELNFTEQGTYQIFEGFSPSNINWHSSISTNGSKLTVTRQLPRPYFAIITPKNDTVLIAERKLIIDSLDNFRDLGGIKTTEGRYVNWGRFYRSDALNELKNVAFPYIKGLDIKRAFDLRSDYEIKTAEDNLPASVIYEHFPIFADNESGMLQGLAQKMNKGGLTKSEAENLLLETYKSFANDDADKFNKLLHQILVEYDYPSVFHCTAGKDRTGYTAAMILAILKVDRKTILDEYDMTNFYTKAKIENYIQNASKLGYGDKIQPEAIGAIMSVNKKYMEAAFQIIDKKYGGIDAYIKNQLGFSDAERAALIQKYTYTY